jgi:hypothetical protein
MGHSKEFYENLAFFTLEYLALIATEAIIITIDPALADLKLYTNLDSPLWSGAMGIVATAEAIALVWLVITSVTLLCIDLIKLMGLALIDLCKVIGLALIDLYKTLAISSHEARQEIEKVASKNS